MSEFFHGARATIRVNKSFAVTQAASGVVFAVGTAPVNQVADWPEIAMATSFEEAKAQLGYSDDWDKFTLCEVMHTHFKKYGVGPIFLVNVADPASSKTPVSPTSKTIVNGVVELPETAIAGTITVSDNGTALVAGTDYEVYYEGGKCFIAAIPNGAMEELTSVTVGYSSFTFTLSSLTDAVIGGYDTTTGKSSGIGLADDVYATFGVNPDILIAPGFSHIQSVQAALNAKTMVNTLFRAMAIVDIDSSTAVTHTAAAAAKASLGLNAPTEIACWPMVRDDDHIYHMSTHIAALMAQVDAQNDDCPSEPQSNKPMLVTAAVLADGSEVRINLSKANHLNANGIVTALNFIGGFRSWGNFTCAWPESGDGVECFISVRRMFHWVANSMILTYWEFVDNKLTRRLCETIADSATVWLNQLTNGGHLYGGRVEFRQEENPDEDIMAGIIRPHLYIAPPGPAQEISFILEYDASYVSTVLAGE